MIVDSLKGKTILRADWDDDDGHDIFQIIFTDGTVYAIQDGAQAGYLSVLRDTTK